MKSEHSPYLLIFHIFKNDDDDAGISPQDKPGLCQFKLKPTPGTVYEVLSHHHDNVAATYDAFVHNIGGD